MDKALPLKAAETDFAQVHLLRQVSGMASMLCLPLISLEILLHDPGLVQILI